MHTEILIAYFVNLFFVDTAFRFGHNLKISIYFLGRRQKRHSELGDSGDSHYCNYQKHAPYAKTETTLEIVSRVKRFFNFKNCFKNCFFNFKNTAITHYKNHVQYNRSFEGTCMSILQWTSVPG